MEKQGVVKPGVTPQLTADEPGVKTASKKDAIRQLDQEDIQKRAADAVRDRLKQ